MARLIVYSAILSNSLAVSLNAWLHYYHLRRKNFPIGDDKLVGRVKKIILSAVIMAAAAMLLMQFGWNAFSPTGIMQEAAGLCILIGLSGLAYGAALHFTGAMRWQDVLAIVQRKNIQ